MPACAPHIGFDALTEAALPLLKVWLKEPHVQLWWGDPEREIELMRQTIGNAAEQGFVVTVDSRPVGYIQCWRPAMYSDEAPWAVELEQKAIAIDMFIGAARDTGKGLGVLIVRGFCARLFEEGADYLVIDPDADNKFAIRAYQKAGFEPLRDYRTPDGVTHIMDLTKIRFQRTV
uniref:GNAT family N-acetyltransferase n=1 Tax=Pararhizobium sp. IMCC3301 TaxID=3067904 RepID=UPI002740FB40|nr:GNAT family N-acetyltransferase [Pararhizobium sp. IMCC3301]